VRALSEVLGQTLPHDNLQDIRFRIAELAPHLIKYDYIEPYNLTSWVTKAKKGEVVNSVFADQVDVSFI
jgi:NADH dehydrogenase (ubiquinone) Fe-S protein 1